MTAGVSAAAAVNSSSAAVTSRCASDWVAPASGTFGLAAAWPCIPLAAALISTSTHHTSWIQASQTITDRMRRIAVMSSWLVSADSLGSGVRQRQAHHGDQRDRHPDGQRDQQDDGADAGQHVTRRPAPDLDRLAQAGNRGRHQQATLASAVPQAR